MIPSIETTITKRLRPTGEGVTIGASQTAALANAKKMDAGALRAGFKAVGNYMADKAELPEGAAAGGGVGGGFTDWKNKQGKGS